MQQHRTAVLIPGRIILPLAAHKARHSARQPERDDNLVDQMGAEIVYRAAAGDGFAFPACASARRERGSVAVEVGFEFGDAA